MQSKPKNNKWAAMAALIILIMCLGLLPACTRSGGSQPEAMTNFDDLTVDDLTVGDDLTVTGSINLPDSLFPLGIDTDNQAAVAVSQDVTGSETVTHGLTTVTWALCSLAEAPGTGAGDGAICTVDVAANVVTAKVWQDDMSAATEVDVAVNLLIIGTP